MRLRGLPAIAAGERAAAALVFGVAFAAAGLLSLAQPVWSRVDEAQHADFIAHLAQGSWPVEGRTRILQATADQMAATGTYRWQLPGREPVPVAHDAADFPERPAGAPPAALNAWTQRNLWTYSYEAAQPPLFYLVAVPVWLAGGVHLVRFLDAFLVGLVALAAFATARRLGLAVAPALAAGLATGLVPGFDLNGSAVTNDTLAAAMGAACLVFALYGHAHGWTRRRALFAGVLLGLALLAKVTAAGVGVAVLVAILLPDAERRVPQRLAQAGIAVGAAVLLVVPWLALNLATYGRLTPAREVNALLGAAFPSEPLSARYLAASVKNGFATFWTGEPWNSLPVNRPLTALALIWVLVACFGLVRARRCLGPSLVIAAAGVAGCCAWAVIAMRLTGVGGLLPGRYLYPMLAALAALLVTGTVAAMPRRWPLLVGAFLALAAVDVTGFAAGWTADRLPTDSRPGAAAGVPADLSTGAGAARLHVDRIYREPAAGRLWLHVTVVDTGDGPLEWWPVAELIRPGSTEVRPSDFAASTPFAARLAPGASVTGWVLFDHLPREVVAGQPVQFRYRAVTTDGYRSLGDLVVTLPPNRP